MSDKPKDPAAEKERLKYSGWLPPAGATEPAKTKRQTLKLDNGDNTGN